MLSESVKKHEAASPPLVRVQKACLEFRLGRAWGARQDLRVLDDVSLDIHAGEIIALVGESGSGKTTLGKALLGLYELTSGSIHIEAKKDVPGPSAAAHDLQMVFQDPLSSFNPRFTIGSSIALPLRMHKRLPEAETHKHVGDLLTKVGLNPEFSQRYPHQMSGGQLQRAALARALALSPRLIIADEAVSKLDVSVRAQILNLIKSLNRSEGISVAFITHDLGVAQFLADRVAVMYFGRIVEIGPTEQVMTAPCHPYTSMLLNARTASTAVVDEAKPNSSGCNFANRCHRASNECTLIRPEMTLRSQKHGFACLHPLD